MCNIEVSIHSRDVKLPFPTPPHKELHPHRLHQLYLHTSTVHVPIKYEKHSLNITKCRPRHLSSTSNWQSRLYSLFSPPSQPCTSYFPTLSSWPRTGRCIAAVRTPRRMICSILSRLDQSDRCRECRRRPAAFGSLGVNLHGWGEG